MSYHNVLAVDAAGGIGSLILKLTMFRKRDIRQKQIKIIIGDRNKVGNHTASFYKQFPGTRNIEPAGNGPNFPCRHN